jgi:glucosamine 6-phosphate synthetase-like amidotransferase/phosphosugar isomerase protein
MCGIVAYFGGAGNPLTRVLTGMSAISYRAPDSTGVAFFGDASDPIRTRKALGSVTDLIAAMGRHPAYLDREQLLTQLWSQWPGAPELSSGQKMLLDAQGLVATAARDKPCTIDDLLATDPGKAMRLVAGSTGDSRPLPTYRIANEDQLQHCLDSLVKTYDLSPETIGMMLREHLGLAVQASCPEQDPQALSGLLDQVMERILNPEQVPAQETAAVAPPEPESWELLWQQLAQTPISVPPDYDRDGVRSTLRALDAALAARLPSNPGLIEGLDERLSRLWPERPHRSGASWQGLYRLEHAANVFGRAAACALHQLQEQVVLPALGQAQPGIDIVLGRTDAFSLNMIAAPVLAHGRWALQSPVTLENCHPFLDEGRQRAIAVNGQFDSEIEERLHRYLKQVAKTRLRSGNSAEYVSLLWGHYYRQLSGDQQRFDQIRLQTETGLADAGIGSQAMDYQIYHQIRGKSPQDLDEKAFMAATRQLMRNGGQIAAAGISLVSPRRMYVASHNRPVFIVLRPDTQDVMVVSDVNAAIGLFPQAMIQDCSRAMHRCRAQAQHRIDQLRHRGALAKQIEAVCHEQAIEENRLCADFRVEIYPLEGEERYARIETQSRMGAVQRNIRIMDAHGAPITDIDPLLTRLKPSQIRGDLHASFFEMHLREVPQHLESLLRTYLPDTAPPAPGVHQKKIMRRFGPMLRNLHRVVLVGTGSSLHMAQTARHFFGQSCPQLDLIAISPQEIDPVARFVSAEQDLVILISWSGTTAEMVELAKVLSALNVVMIGVTEKPFADLALITARSGGVIQTFSGEEVSVAAAKSPFCSLTCLALTAIWLGEQCGQKEAALALRTALTALPETVATLAQDPRLTLFCQQVAADHRKTEICLVIYPPGETGMALEAAWKLEESSWTAPSLVRTYDQLDDTLMARVAKNTLVLVQATSRSNLDSAIAIIARLHRAQVPFAILCCTTREQDAVAQYSKECCFFLPEGNDLIRPFLELTCLMELALSFGRAHGRNTGGFPRNRAKSVTVGRSRTLKNPSPASVIRAMDTGHEPLGVGPATHCPSPPPAWEAMAGSDRERRFYRAIRRLAASVSMKTPASFDEKTAQVLAKHLFEEMPPDGHLVIAPLDLRAEAAARSFAAQWSMLLPCGIRVEPKPVAEVLGENACLIFCASRPPAPRQVPSPDLAMGTPWLWLGKQPETGLASEISDLTACDFDPEFPETASDVLYLAFCRLFIGLWNIRHPGLGTVIARSLEQLPALMETILADTGLFNAIDRMMADNRCFASTFYIAPDSGSSLFWESAFSHGPVVIGHRFGESAHGPLVTVDPHFAGKFIPLAPRQAMMNAYGSTRVETWESEILSGVDVDRFLANPHPLSRSVSPFFAEGSWYLPVIRPDYDPNNDNPIILDALSLRLFAPALDELATFGCRFARMAVITQKAFEAHPDAQVIYKQPVSHHLKVPAVSQNHPIPELLLPFVRHLLAIRAAGAASERKS